MAAATASDTKPLAAMTRASIAPPASRPAPCPSPVSAAATTLAIRLTTATALATIKTNRKIDHPLFSLRTQQIGRAHACTPLTTAHLLCPLLLDKTTYHPPTHNN